MRVLFVRSGNSGIDPISTNQGASLSSIGINVEYFDIIGKGLSGYLSNLNKLRRSIKKINPDIIHAHYYLSGILAALSLPSQPIITSLMGSDINEANNVLRKIISIFNRLFWSKVIVKSEQMHKSLLFNNSSVVPNGVDINIFKPLEKNYSLNKLGWDPSFIHLLFSSDPGRKEKNYGLVEQALQKLETSQYQVHYLTGITPSDMPLYYNAASVLLLSSHAEGSPNVVKEAMVCNCPIVATDVGDVKWIVGNTPGCYITSFNPVEYSIKIKEAIEFSQIYQKTHGRERILALGLDARSIAFIILKIYKSILKTNK